VYAYRHGTKKKKKASAEKIGQPGAERSGSGRFAAKLMPMRRIRHKGSGGKKKQKWHHVQYFSIQCQGRIPTILYCASRF
jgi:hypothetical protein